MKLLHLAAATLMTGTLLMGTAGTAHALPSRDEQRLLAQSKEYFEEDVVNTSCWDYQTYFTNNGRATREYARWFILNNMVTYQHPPAGALSQDYREAFEALQLHFVEVHLNKATRCGVFSPYGLGYPNGNGRNSGGSFNLSS